MTKDETITDLQLKIKALHKKLDERNEATKVWIQADTQTREYAHRLELLLGDISPASCI